MENLNVNKILCREKEETSIKNILLNFDKEKNNPLAKKGIYLYGDPGIGKTNFVTAILKDLEYDIISYDAGDIRNKNIIETFTKHNVSDVNIMSMFKKKTKKIAILMDEIDGMNNGDKGGINALIKLMRPKKTKKQKTEEFTIIPIICIGNYYQDKKIKELIKICHTFELKKPEKPQFMILLSNIFTNVSKEELEKICKFVNYDLRKLNTFYSIYLKNPNILNDDVMQHILHVNTSNDDTKLITHKLIEEKYTIKDHGCVMNETDRTIVALLWHENIVDVLAKGEKKITIPFYLKLLKNMCFADYIDRITFQKQIWQFNEMSSLIKTFYNNKIYHDTFEKPKLNKCDVRFTKVLTKYSTEYNNSLFIQHLSQQLEMDRKDLLIFFMDLKKDDKEIDMNIFENYDISKLDVNRIFRYLDKYSKETVVEDDENINNIDVQEF